MAFFLKALGFRQHAGLQAQHAVSHDKACQFAAGQHIIADRYFLIGKRLNHPLIDALVMAADQRQAVAGR